MTIESKYGIQNGDETWLKSGIIKLTNKKGKRLQRHFMENVVANSIDRKPTDDKRLAKKRVQYLNDLDSYQDFEMIINQATLHDALG